MNLTNARLQTPLTNDLTDNLESCLVCQVVEELSDGPLLQERTLLRSPPCCSATHLGGSSGHDPASPVGDGSSRVSPGYFQLQLVPILPRLVLHVKPTRLLSNQHFLQVQGVLISHPRPDRVVVAVGSLTTTGVAQHPKCHPRHEPLHSEERHVRSGIQ